MATASNYFSPRAHNDVQNSDTQSEFSESGTTASGFNSNWSSREELRDFVVKHGAKDVSELYQERFRVDRKKLQQMLCGDNEALTPADVFFAKIMEDTDTYITWPNKLKLDAKSKKDPFVRIAGWPEHVHSAKERIVTILDARGNRLTMKMDVSYTDHSHIIGRGGHSIKRVMDETQCHVHFPDSNRSNATEKSNHVSISGSLGGVESARSRVRELAPLIFGFEPPIRSQNIDNSCPYVIKIAEQYNVQVMFKTRSKLHAVIVLVKGVEWELNQVKQATICLMDYMCDNLVNQIPVQMTIQISPQHHQVVIGPNHSNLKAIMHATNCKIMFPDAQDQNIPSLKKSNISISGSVHNVYRARQYLIGSLPLLIVFDLPENATLNTDADQIADIQNACDVQINVRQRTKQAIKCCIIKGVERHATNIYKARNMVLNINETPLRAYIPPSYNLPVTKSLAPITPFSANSDDLLTPTNLNPMSPAITSHMAWHYGPNCGGSSGATPLNTPNLHHPQFVGLSKQPQFTFNPEAPSIGNSTSGFHSFDQKSKTMDSFGVSSLSSISSCDSVFHESPPKRPPGFEQQDFQVESEAKRLAGLKAMQARPNPDMFRVPTSQWSGFGISHTSPGDIWKNSAAGGEAPTVNLNASNAFDGNSAHIMQKLTHTSWSDVPEMLNSLGLETYVKLFVKNEVDLSVFATFSEKDLVTLGVEAFGSRKKMMLAIVELNRRSVGFSAAPGAERRHNSNDQGEIKV